MEDSVKYEVKNKLTTVAYTKDKKKELDTICKRLKISKTQFIDAAIHQYYRTGEDPREPIKASLPKQLSKLENRLIGFIKTQDSEYLSEIVKYSKATLGEIQKIKSTNDANRKNFQEIQSDINDINENLLAILDQRKEDVERIKVRDEEITKRQILVDNNAKFYLKQYEEHLEKALKQVRITQNNKQKAIAMVQEAKGMTGSVSANTVIEIISSM